jgi:hypothetical protein
MYKQRKIRVIRQRDAMAVPAGNAPDRAVPTKPVSTGSTCKAAAQGLCVIRQRDAMTAAVPAGNAPDRAVSTKPVSAGRTYSAAAQDLCG